MIDFFLCNLYKRDPEILVTKKGNIILLNETLTFKEKANVGGTFTNSVLNTGIISVDKSIKKIIETMKFFFFNLIFFFNLTLLFKSTTY